MTRLASTAAIVVLFVWAASALDGIIRHDYGALQYVTPVMLVLAGALFGVDIIRRNGQKKREREEED